MLNSMLQDAVCYIQKKFPKMPEHLCSGPFHPFRQFATCLFLMEVGRHHDFIGAFTGGYLATDDIYIHSGSGEVLTPVNKPLEDRHHHNDAKHSYTVV